MNRRVIEFHYTVSAPSGQVLDTSIGETPMACLEGARQIVPGLEAALLRLFPGGKQGGAGHTSGALYLSSVISRARFFPKLWEWKYAHQKIAGYKDEQP